MANRTHIRIFRICSWAMIGAVCLLIGCGSSTDVTEIDPETDQEIAMETFESNNALKDYILDQYSKSVLPGSAYGPSWENNGEPTDSALVPDTDGVACTGAGSVNGKILNQFSLGEYEDVLRIAAINGEIWLGNGGKSNSVYCLTVEDKMFKMIGKIEDIAEGESIYAVRFIGQRGYLVTFVAVRQNAVHSADFNSIDTTTNTHDLAP